ncbi:MAG: hypothetical protein ABJ000_00870 [Saccharospirillum sp.]|uniref:hypothetical protein n=1 Tax=Saccharospirillum sp. TaxID=2033801 RepID=UPI00329750BE
MNRALVLGGGLLCATLATAEPGLAAKISLTTGPTETDVAISISKEGLHLGQTSLEPWPFDAPDCTGCTLTLERDFSPVGPDRTLQLTAPGADTPTWFFAERLRLPASLPGNATLRAQPGSSGLRLEAEGEQATLTAGEAVWLNNCHYHLIWYSQPSTPANRTAEPAPAQQPGGVAPVPQQTVIAEDPTRLIQIQGQCS